MPKALVTGAGGFIGSHLVEHLLRQGWSVRAMLRYTSTGTLGMLGEIGDRSHPLLELAWGDVRDQDSVNEAVAGTDVVFNLAALIGIPYSYVAPESYIQTNVTGTLNVLRAVQRSKVRRLVQTSTSETYGSAQYVPIDEHHPARAQSPYAASKVASDELALSFHRSFETPVVILRPFNTFGPRQSPRAVIPTIVAQALFSDHIRLGSLRPVRDFLFVRDTCAAFHAVAETPGIEGEVFNCASGTGIAIKDVVDVVCKQIGRTVPIEQEPARVRPEGSEVDRLIGSYDKLRERTGWHPGVSFEDGLAAVASWVRCQEPVVDVRRYVR